jgi:cell wall-associated NlpC family hydrolase
MSMTNNFGAASQRNPRESARDFAEQERERRQGRSADTMSGRFQPALSTMPEPTSVSEQAVAQPSWIDQQNVGIQEGQQALQQATERAFQTVQMRQQQQTQQDTGGGVQRQINYQADPNLSQSRQEVLNRTASYQGTPYQLGGRTAQGIDCSGLVMSVYNSLGFDIKSHSVSGQARAIPGVKTAVNNLKPGDLVVWNDNSHIAVYAGNGQIWDASRSKGTSLRPLWAPQNQVYGIAVRLPGE